MIQPSPEAVDAALLELNIGQAARPVVARALSAAYAVDWLRPKQPRRKRRWR